MLAGKRWAGFSYPYENVAERIQDGERKQTA
jgi:hypothetical protein